MGLWPVFSGFLLLPVKQCPSPVWGWYRAYYLIQVYNKVWRGKCGFSISLYLLSCPARSTGAPGRLGQTSFCLVTESTFGMLAFSSLFTFRAVIKARKKKHQGKSVNFSNISIHLQRANSLEFLLPLLKLETLTTVGSTAILTWQTKPNSVHLQLHVSDVSSCGQRVSLFSVFHPETTFCKWRENHCWIKGNPCHGDQAHNFN